MFVCLKSVFAFDLFQSIDLFLFHRISDFVAIESCSQMFSPQKFLKSLLIFGFCNKQWINFSFFSSFSCMFLWITELCAFSFPNFTIMTLWYTQQYHFFPFNFCSFIKFFFFFLFLLRIKIFSFTIISLMFNFYTFLVFLYILLIFIWMEKTRMK